MIKQAGHADIRILAELAVHIYENSSPTELETEFSALMNRGTTAFFLKLHDDQPIGFAQCSLRTDYVEGTSGSPVGYLEGIYIKEAYRKNGYAAALLDTCEKWTMERGCCAFASDCALDNTNSLQFHLAVGFAEVNRVICFAKQLQPKENTCVYNKLVRDRIPEIILSSGKIPKTQTLSDEAYLNMIDAKLDEELAEYHKDQTMEELADLLEVIYAAVTARGYSLETLEAVRAQKAEQRGRFEKKILLIETTET